MYTWNGKSTEADELVGIGCSSQESVAKDKTTGTLFFANENGIYATRGGFPQKISRFVQPFFDNMSSSNYEHIAGGCDGEHYFCSIGNVTINGRTINNAVIRYSIQSQEFAILSYPTQPRIFSQYIDGTDVKLLYGDNDGNVIQIDSSDENDNYASTTDYPIDYELNTYNIFAPIKGVKKKITDLICVNSKESSGAKLLYRKNSELEENWQTLGEIKKDIQIFNISGIEYNILQFRIAGRSITGNIRIESIEIPQIELLHYDK